jgi:hypothetical protein
MSTFDFLWRSCRGYGFLFCNIYIAFSYKLKGRKFAYANVPNVIQGGGGGQCEDYFYLENWLKEILVQPIVKIIFVSTFLNILLLGEIKMQ